MKILLDHNLTLHIKRFLPGHSVYTAEEMRWNLFSNGVLLRTAEQNGFDILVSADQSIFYQQNNLHRKIALVILTTNDWSYIAKHMDVVAQAALRATQGSFELVYLPKSSAQGQRL